ncbi:hypothetical protein [Streptomyces akebiae]|uniref:Lipoprotein n=1 Tax=Streptomyces akebiae TaxID=2865673 RepID=A0ABX8XN07_9ACTN|nr:hypothetical protein [Streptomyces akebiae]QYX77120.1 hypothetical protein K1J60_11835 [Streptomyces akebiae]
MRFPHRRYHRLAVTGLVAALALTATACASDDRGAGDDPGATSSRTADRDGDGIPDVLADKLEEHGVDIGDWKNGGWKNWDRDTWLSEAGATARLQPTRRCASAVAEAGQAGREQGIRGGHAPALAGGERAGQPESEAGICSRTASTEPAP